ncbi:hypothetical protein PIROE2DRAFT_18719 [Piromyces sp. E2]|nr:hypothetical protein PIROE2DRAFT_18719 [Piromyces sp. E2]|eukprot:OUM56599.1 hypothetical protein PIROE2DRAFT_18719 [Piromyces sp. E2]
MNMKIFIRLVSYLSILNLTAAKSYYTHIDSVKECQIFYSITGKNNTNCCLYTKDNNYSQCENGHIIKIHLEKYENTFTEIPKEILELKNLKEL